MEAFAPELVINCVTLSRTLEAFDAVLPHLRPGCIISDIASVKTGLAEYYARCGFPYVSTHPMFGPTFANLGNLMNENAILISEGDHLGRVFFKDLYGRLKLNIFEYTFDEHDRVVAQSLGIPFASTFVFVATMEHQDAPTRNHLPAPHEDRPRRTLRRRLPALRDPLQPPHARSD